VVPREIQGELYEQTQTPLGSPLEFGVNDADWQVSPSELTEFLTEEQINAVECITGEAGRVATVFEGQDGEGPLYTIISPDGKDVWVSVRRSGV
jgi:hypothetical protein